MKHRRSLAAENSLTASDERHHRRDPPVALTVCPGVVLSIIAFGVTPTTWQPWVILVGGLVLTGLLVRHVQVNTAYRAIIMAAEARLTREITERKRTETELRRLAMITQQAGEGIAVVSLDGVLQFVNAACAKMHACETGDELLGEHLSIFHTDEQMKTDVMPFNEEVKRNGYHTGEVGHVRRDGTVFPAEMTATLLRERGGKPTGLIAFMTDITKRKHAESALRESEARFRVISASAQDAIIMLDGNGNISFWNEAAQSIFGYTREDVIGRCLHTFLAPKRFHEAHFRAFPTFQETGRGDAVGKTLELAAVRNTGEEIPIELSLSAVRLNGEWHAVGIARDITTRKQAEEELQRLNQELLHASRRAGMAEVATGILHNVGNVLTAVNTTAAAVATSVRESKVARLASVAQLVSEHAGDLGAFITQDDRGKHLPVYLAKLAEHLGEEQARILAELKSLGNDIEHINKIIATQQDYSGMPAVVEPVSIVDVLEDVLRMNAISTERRGIHVVREYGEVPPVVVDKHKLLQVLVNLITNAKHALREGGGPHPRLTLRTRKSGNGRVQAEVIDDGVGIREENLTMVFSHGFTTKNDGHGFGLHAAALAAKEMGGSLTAHSDGPGKGATFTLDLPLQPAKVKP